MVAFRGHAVGWGRTESSWRWGEPATGGQSQHQKGAYDESCRYVVKEEAGSQGAGFSRNHAWMGRCPAPGNFNATVAIRLPRL